MTIDTTNIDHRRLNEIVAQSEDKTINLENVLGQRFIACGVAGKKFMINGTPGNALGAYMDGSYVEVHGNAQDAIGDTMNAGTIIVHGSCGDAVGYAMRGGEIYIKKNAGYRVGIHMKEYNEHKPAIVVGGKTGAFLAEYQAGGVLIVLNMFEEGEPFQNYVGVGMHGGAIYIRGEFDRNKLSEHVICRECSAIDMKNIKSYIAKYSEKFKIDIKDILSKPFYKVTPSGINPFKNLYTFN